MNVLSGANRVGLN
ncbi:hypothetical protein EO244_05085 [Ancylomarina salipaludis]|uniref:Uncharacterized protein n=1 Tax=Ancylomarina salipaludis TaxID=2501299 RepID=A0A4V1N0D8_9BACT|nr:hypothetical protein EO244_05085 [Ancylomarina salipaludis]